MKINTGIIGLGEMGKIHYENLSFLSNVHIVGICDLNIDPSDYKNVRLITTDYKELINREDIEAIVVCSGAKTHKSILSLAIKKNKKIFCEKPLAVDSNSMKYIIDIAKKANSHLQIGYHRRFDKHFQALKYKTNSLGRIRQIHIISRDPRPPTAGQIANDGNIFMTTSTHDFDMVRYLTNQEVVSVYARGININKSLKNYSPDNVVISLVLSEGTLVSITNSYNCSYGYDQRVEVFGDNGICYINNDYDNEVVFEGSNGLSKDKPHYFYTQRYKEAYMNEMEDFINGIIGKKKFTVNELDAYETFLIQEAVTTSFKQNHAVKIR